MKLMIAGSRSISDIDLSQYIPNGVELIISGGATGVDTLAEKYADEKKISKLILRPRYDLYGRLAPLKRNESMIDIADEIIVVWDGVSKGSDYTIKYAKKKNKKLVLINISAEKIN
ncbi:MAG: hypothetical protein IKV16_07155 [Clostridia bacterium]|nr:hypothetical protein [Clostridia bacterium]